MKLQKSAVAASIVALLGVSYVGATAIIASKVHHTLDSLQQQGTIAALSGAGSYQDVHVHDGLFQSSLDADVVVASAVGELSMPTHIEIQQWPTFLGPARATFTFGVPDMGKMHDFLQSMHATEVMHGRMSVGWNDSANLSARAPGFAGKTAQGVNVQWAGATLQGNFTTATTGDVDIASGALSVADPKAGGHLNVSSMHVAYGIDGHQQGKAHLEFEIGKSTAGNGAQNYTLAGASLNTKFSWDLDQRDSRQYVSLDDADVQVHVQQPAANAIVRAQGTIPLNAALERMAQTDPMVFAFGLEKIADGRLTVQTDNGMLALVPSLSAQAKALGAVQQNGMWTVQTVLQGGRVMINGRPAA